MPEITKATLNATLLDILPGSPPAVLVEKQTRSQSGTRLFTQQVAVIDAKLYQQICGQARKGDAVRVTITTEWYEDHSMAYVSAFALNAPTAEVELAAVV